MIVPINPQEAVKLTVVSSDNTAKVKQTDNVYEGEYSVLPSGSEDTVLETKGKRMKKDVTIVKVPSYEVSNLQGGNTVYIGGEYSGNF